MSDPHGHIPVLLGETMAILAPLPGEVCVDCTVGRGGHAAALAEGVGREGVVIGFDLDAKNLEYTRNRLEVASLGDQFVGVHDSFVRIEEHVGKVGRRVDVVLADLGVSSNQLDDAERGFGFRAEGRLDMRLNPQKGRSVGEFLALVTEKELAEVIFRFGEDPYARKIARKFAQAREEKPIESSAQLAQLVVEAYGSRARSSRMHPATRTFMALRIAVNDELSALEVLLDSITRAAEGVDEGGWLNWGARIAVIGFHSLEDRPVKRAFAKLGQRGLAERLTKKPITATNDEIRANPRSRSAKLRGIRLRTAGTIGPALS